MGTVTEKGAGKEVLSYCGKCKMPLAHIIINTNKKGEADKCECKTCGAVHKYRDPDKAAKTAARKAAPKKAKVSPEELWKEAISKGKGFTKEYAMSEAFSEGDLLEHATFGKGIVRQLIDANKMHVIFESGEKTLAYNR